MQEKEERPLSRIFKDGTLITRAIQKAVEEALREHIRAGVSVVIWRDGKVVELQGSEITRELDNNVTSK